MIKEEAYAKINLSLDVSGRRDNGYHDVRMVMQSISLHDTLIFEKNDAFTLATDNAELAKESDEGKENIILKACRVLTEYKGAFGGAKITLTKRIPIAAGMAGGSTDAAATLRGLNRLYDLGLSMQELETIAVKIGADVPFCVRGGTALSEGIGEILTKLKTPSETKIVIVKPDINVSTKDVYEAFDSLSKPFHPDVDAMVKAVNEDDIDEIVSNLGNSLEAVTKGLHPVIGEIEEFMLENGARGALMSGSGPTVFAITDDINVTALEAKFKQKYPAYYVKGHFYGKTIS
jgi:4-diphosphocytidyl-2-C-methyl-D-erythritol kinase